MQLSLSQVSFSQFHQWLTPYIPSQLIALEFKEKILQCTDLLLSSFTSELFSYECLLKGKELWGDILIPLSSHFDFQELQEFSASQESWQWKNLSLFLKRGIDQKLFHKNCIDSLWLEFDTGSSLNWPPQPNIILSMNNSQIDPLEIAKEAFFYLKGKELPKETLECMRRCCAKNFSIVSLVLMLARPSDALRFRLENRCILPSSDLFAYLKSISHPCLNTSFLKDYDRLKEFLQETTFYADAIEGRIFPRLDFLITTKRLEPRLTEWWERLLKSLVTEKLVEKEKGRALLSWIGEEIEPQNSQRISNTLFPDNREPSHLLIRRIGQIKLLYLPGKSVQTKAYFGARTIPLQQGMAVENPIKAL